MDAQEKRPSTVLALATALHAAADLHVVFVADIQMLIFRTMLRACFSEVTTAAAASFLELWTNKADSVFSPTTRRCDSARGVWQTGWSPRRPARVLHDANIQAILRLLNPLLYWFQVWCCSRSLADRLFATPVNTWRACSAAVPF